MADTRSMALRMALDSIAVTGGAWTDDAIIRRAEAFDNFLSTEKPKDAQSADAYYIFPGGAAESPVTRAEIEDMVNTRLKRIARVDGLFYPNRPGEEL